MRGILEYSEAPLVSSDIIGNPHSSIFDAGLTAPWATATLRLLAWYDNEWGYSQSSHRSGAQDGRRRGEQLKVPKKASPKSPKSKPMERRAKIVATLGPASTEEAVLRRLLRAGVDVVRFNLSHGSHTEHRGRLQLVRRSPTKSAITCRCCST